MTGRETIAALLTGMAAPVLAQTAVESASTPTPATPPAGQQAAAAPGPASSRRVYDAAYFAPFSPATAAQIVARVPGFALEQVDESVRGFAGAAGNVVINGQRPSSKADTIETILQRIPAARVLRVEVGPGDLFGADYASKPQVLNLVLTVTGGLAGTAEAGLRRDFTGQLLPQGSVSALLKRGRSTFNASVTVQNQLTSEEGTDTLRTLPGGAVTETRRKVNDIHDPSLAVAGSWAFDDGANRTANLNARVAGDRLSLTQRNRVMPVGGTIRDDFLTQRYRTDGFEIGGDVTRPFAGGGIKLVGLATRRSRQLRDGSFNRIGDTVLGGFTQSVDNRRDETLGRLVWIRDGLAGWSVEIGAEAVLNRLESDVDLFRVEAGGGRTRVDLPIDSAVVEERRGEAFVNVGRALTPRLRLDTGATVETSRLTVTGDAQASRALTFLKPKATLDWRPGGRWHATLSLRRTVAQLQFEDFISSAELASERVNGGNAELLPQRAWEALGTVEHPLLGDGLVKLELGYTHVSLVQDRVPTADGFDAPGNLGDGRVLIVRGRVEAPLARLGVPGGRLTLNGSLASTRVTDPYTLEPRPFSGNVAFFGNAEFRQDRRGYAWGFNVQARTPFTTFRRDELDRNVADFPFVTAFAEWRPEPRTTVALTLSNLAQVTGRRQRTFFRPDRRTRAPVAFEERVRNQHLVPFLSVRRSFG